MGFPHSFKDMLPFFECCSSKAAIGKSAISMDVCLFAYNYLSKSYQFII